MKLILFLLVDSLSKTLKTVFNGEIKCDVNKLSIPKNSNGWICGPTQDDLDGIASCIIDCADHFQLKQGSPTQQLCFFQQLCYFLIL